MKEGWATPAWFAHHHQMVALAVQRAVVAQENQVVT